MADVDISKIQLPDGTGCNLKDATARSTANSAYNAATTVANSSSYGVVKLSASVSSTSGTSGGIAATPSAVRSAYNLADSAYDLADAAYDDGTRTGDSYTQGQVKLSDSVDSDYDVSDGVAATPLAVKSVRDVVGEFNKNLIIFNPATEYIDGVTFMPLNNVSYYTPTGTERSMRVYGLSIKKTGKATSEVYYTVNVSNIYLEGSSNYVISGCPSGGSISTYCLIVYDVLSNNILARCSGTNPTTFYIDEHKYVDVKIYINTESSSSELTFTPMLCTKSAYDLDPSYTSQINAIANSWNIGKVKLSDAVDSESNSYALGVAATPYAVKKAYDAGTRTGNFSTQGQVRLSDGTNSTSGEDNGIAATPYAVKIVHERGTRTGNSSTQGQVKLSDSTSSTSGVDDGVAATPYAVKQAYDDGTRISNEYTLGQVMLSDAAESDYDVSDGIAATPYAVKIVHERGTRTGNSSTQGQVKLSDSTSSTSGVDDGVAATPYAVKQAYDDGTRISNEYTLGQVMLSDAAESDYDVSDGIAATPYAVKKAYDAGTRTGNSSTKGQVKLSDSTSSTSGVSDGIAATPYAVKKAYDKADTGTLYKNLVCVRRTESSYLYNNIRYDAVSNQSASDCGYIYVYGNNNGAASDVSYYVVNDRQVYLDPGEYILTGCPVGGSTTTYRLRAHNVENASVAIADDVGSGATFTVTSRIAVQVRIYIYPAAGSISTSSKKVFRPMICLKSAYDADSSFVPGRFPVGTDAVYGMVKLTDTADVDHDAYEGIAASATAVHKAYSLANTANTAASTANTSLANKVQTLGYQTGTSPYLYYNKDGSATKTSFCSMATSVTSGNSYPVTSGAVYTYLNNNYYDSDDVDSEINNAISDRPQIVYCQVKTESTGTTLAQVSGLSFTTNGNYTYRITASLSYTRTKTSEISIWTTNGYCWAQALNNGSTDIGVLTCTALMSSMARTIIVKAKSQASGNNVVTLLVEKLPVIS